MFFNVVDISALIIAADGSFCFYSLNHINYNVHIAADPTPVNFDHDAHACGPTMCAQQIMTTDLL